MLGPIDSLIIQPSLSPFLQGFLGTVITKSRTVWLGIFSSPGLRCCFTGVGRCRRSQIFLIRWCDALASGWCQIVVSRPLVTLEHRVDLGRASLGLMGADGDWCWSTSIAHIHLHLTLTLGTGYSARVTVQRLLTPTLPLWSCEPLVSPGKLWLWTPSSPLRWTSLTQGDLCCMSDQGFRKKSLSLAVLSSRRSVVDRPRKVGPLNRARFWCWMPLFHFCKFFRVHLGIRMSLWLGTLAPLGLHRGSTEVGRWQKGRKISQNGYTSNGPVSHQYGYSTCLVEFPGTLGH